MNQALLAQALGLVFSTGVRVEVIFQKILKENPRLGSQNRRLFGRQLFDAVRWIRPLLNEAKLSWRESWIYKSENWLFDGLQNLTHADWNKVSELIQSKEPGQLHESQLILLVEKPSAENSSCSDFLYHFFVTDCGHQRAIRELENLNRPSEIYVRRNLILKPNKSQTKILKEFESSLGPLISLENGFVLKDRKTLLSLQKQLPGFFEVQDPSSQKVSLFANPTPGSVVIDGCAGQGGKTLHLAGLLRNSGQLVALDVNEMRLLRLRQRARLAGVENLQVFQIEKAGLSTSLRGAADLLLLDLPCSGSGVLKRNLDDKYRINEEQMNQLENLQRKILLKQSSFVRKGGRLIFVTCSLFRRENEEQLAWFLSECPQFELTRSQTLWPSETQHDGFFMAELILRH